MEFQAFVISGSGASTANVYPDVDVLPMVDAPWSVLKASSLYAIFSALYKEGAVELGATRRQ